MSNNDIWIKIFGIVIILLLLKILIAIQSNQTKCIEMYGVNEENYSECMWLLENQTNDE